MLNRGTRPGSKFESRNYEVIFVAGHQLGIGCYLVEYEKDWTLLMEIILTTLEKVTNHTDTLRTAMADHVQHHSAVILGDIQPDIRVDIEILDQNYFPLKQTKSLHVTFYDNFKTSLVFFIRRKQVLKSLKDASLQKLSELLKKTEKGSLESIEIPESLKREVLIESSYIWNQRQVSARSIQNFNDRKMFRRDYSWRALQYLMI